MSLFNVEIADGGYEDGLVEVVGLRVRCGCPRCIAVGRPCGSGRRASPSAEPIKARIEFEALLHLWGWKLSRHKPRWICKGCATTCDQIPIPDALQEVA